MLRREEGSVMKEPPCDGQRRSAGDPPSAKHWEGAHPVRMALDCLMLYHDVTNSKRARRDLEGLDGELVRALERLGFCYVGTMREMFLALPISLLSHQFVHQRAPVRANVSRGPRGTAMSYIFYTLFDGDFGLSSTSRSQSFASSPTLQVTTTHGSIDEDLTRHLEKVRHWEGQGRRALATRDMNDVVGAYRYHYRKLVPMKMAIKLLRRSTVMVLWLGVMLWLLVPAIMSLL